MNKIAVRLLRISHNIIAEIRERLSPQTESLIEDRLERQEGAEVLRDKPPSIKEQNLEAIISRYFSYILDSLQQQRKPTIRLDKLIEGIKDVPQLSTVGFKDDYFRVFREDTLANIIRAVGNNYLREIGRTDLELDANFPDLVTSEDLQQKVFDSAVDITIESLSSQNYSSIKLEDDVKQEVEKAVEEALDEQVKTEEEATEGEDALGEFSEAVES